MRLPASLTAFESRHQETQVSLGRSPAKIQLEFVDETPAPSFAGLDGSHNGVLGRVEVLGGMFVLGGIATADVTATQAQAEVYPAVAHLQTLFTTPGMRFDLLDLIKVSALAH